VKITDIFVTRSFPRSRVEIGPPYGKAGLAGIKSVIEDREGGSLGWNDPGLQHEQAPAARIKECNKECKRKLEI
jgi:hypothetical protein